MFLMKECIMRLERLNLGLDEKNRWKNLDT